MSSEALNSERIARAAAGDVDELESLIRTLNSELRAGVSIQPLWRRSIDVDDVLQVSYLEAFLRIGSLREHTPAAFKVWMRRLVDNNLRDAIRALERDKRPDARRRETRGVAGESSRTLFARLIGTDATASGPAVLREDIERLRAALEKLPTSYREVVEKIDLAERDVADVAGEMGRSRGAVHLLRSRAHDRLQELLRD